MAKIWKDIVGYEGLYKISSDGIIESLKTGKYKKLTLSSTGYLVTTLYKNNKGTTKYIHRLIAEHFIYNPKNLKVINHIDGDKTNNSLKNLEWCTYSQNNKHAFENGLKTVSEINKKRFGLLASQRCKSNPPRRIAINIYSLDKKLIHECNSIKDAAEYLNCNIETISNAINRKSRLLKNYLIKEA